MCVSVCVCVCVCVFVYMFKLLKSFIYTTVDKFPDMELKIA